MASVPRNLEEMVRKGQQIDLGRQQPMTTGQYYIKQYSDGAFPIFVPWMKMTDGVDRPGTDGAFGPVWFVSPTHLIEFMLQVGQTPIDPPSEDTAPELDAEQQAAVESATSE